MQFLIKIKDQLKSSIWVPLRAFSQDNRIRNELVFYTKKAQKIGIDKKQILNQDYVKSLFEKRIATQKKEPQKRKKGELNIIYLSPFDYWERANIPYSLEKFGNVKYFIPNDYGYKILEQDYPSNWTEVRRKLNDTIFNFISQAHKDRPVDIIISYLSGYHLLPETIDKINELGIITTAFWLDDKFKFRAGFDGEVFKGAASVCSHYDLNLTSASSSVIKYFVEGGLAIFWPEGGNPNHFKPIDVTFIYDVSFVGAKYGARPKYISHLLKNGIKINTFGKGWPSGSVNPNDMIKIYAQSKINLGFNGQGYSMTSTHLKGRDFEVPLCGSVYLTSHDEDHEKVFDIGKEIFTYSTKKELLTKVKMLLNDENLCAKSRIMAREKCLKNHTWEKRFQDLFEFTGLI